MTRNWTGDVYVIFGDTLRADGGNMYGIYVTLDAAKEEMELLKQRKPFIEYHIEEFGLWE